MFFLIFFDFSKIFHEIINFKIKLYLIYKNNLKLKINLINTKIYETQQC